MVALTALVFLSAIGWVMNIIHIIHIGFDPMTVLQVFRLVGVVFGPLGVVLGYAA
jgi:asparagine N-glycosylation enzyme membrane subunit Stt3